MTLITDGFISIFTPSKALRGYRMGRMGRAIASSTRWSWSAWSCWTCSDTTVYRWSEVINQTGLTVHGVQHGVSGDRLWGHRRRFGTVHYLQRWIEADCEKLAAPPLRVQGNTPLLRHLWFLSYAAAVSRFTSAQWHFRKNLIVQTIKSGATCTRSSERGRTGRSL